MNKTPVRAVYKGNGIIQLYDQRDLQNDQELLVTIMPIFVEQEITGEARPIPLIYFRQLVSRLRQYEEKYGMNSEEFYRQFQSGAIPEGSFDYFDWRVLYDGCRRMQERFGFSRVADV
jgi:hypothetical protein